MTVDILNIDGQSTGRSIELPANIFGVEANEHTVYLAIKQYLANQRQGTHKAKERGEVAGSTRKLKRQKGTGTARFGDIKNPLFRGGGRMFGPRPRNYTLRLNKKTKRLARKVVLANKAQEGNLLIVEDFSFDAPKTKAFMNVLRALKLDGKKTVMVTPEYDKDVYLSSRNVPKVRVTRAQDLNTYEVLNAQTLVVSESALSKITESFK